MCRGKHLAGVLSLALELKLALGVQLLAEHAIRSGVSDVRIHAALARAKALQKDFEGMEAVLSEAQKLFPDNPNLRSLAERLRDRQGRFTAQASG